MPRPVLTPGLTPLQRSQVADVLQRVGLVPRGLLGSLFIDVDRAAARVLDSVRPSREDCRIIAEELAAAHDVDVLTIAFAYGHAIGVRQGRMFTPIPKRAKHWISEEYRQLSEPNRRMAAKFIRQLLKAQGTPRQPGTPAYAPPVKAVREEAEIEAATRWLREIGKAARKLR